MSDVLLSSFVWFYVGAVVGLLLGVVFVVLVSTMHDGGTNE